MDRPDVEAAREVVVERLIQPLDTASRDAAIARAKPGQRVVPYMSSVGAGADAGSVRFRKERHVDGQYLAAVEWVSGEERPMCGVFSLVPDDDGAWRCRGAHSSGLGGDPRRGRPWVNAGAGGDPFYVGGRLLEADGVTLVRVRFSDGLVMDDVPGPDGIVLFPSGRPPAPGWQTDAGAMAELRGPDGSVVARHRLFGRADPI